ncbi:dCTP deaminase [Nitrincola sp. MINF-07-Sa-05]|uniref:dCTP deaminase n=1 Tax=Nitrincola salilacus TaxID=3400273 RepID=UPI0039181C57
MVLGDRQIKEAYENSEILISPFDENQIQPASYDLRVGEEAVTTSHEGIINIKDKGFLKLKPGDFAVITVYEEIKLGPQYVGRFGLRSGYARRGLIATTGPQIDPGYHGRLIVGITNLTPQDITVAYLDKFLSVEFHKLDRAVLKPYSGPYQGRFKLSAEEIRIVAEKDGVPLVKVLQSVEEIRKEVHGLSTSTSLIKWVIGIGVPVLGVILAIK